MFTSTKNTLGDQTLGAQATLDAFNDLEHGGPCLAHLFTSRDFSGVLGFAFLGDAPPGKSGICSNRNTGISTNIDYIEHIAEAVSIATLAHEIGHNFGAPVNAYSSCQCSGA